LPVSQKPESQDICFVSGDYRRFLDGELSFMSRPGSIVDKRGRVLGRHKGLASFTIGQRRGIGISSKTPLYVLSLNSRKNEVVVGTKEEGYGREFTVEETNFISGHKLGAETRAMVKIRYLHQASPAALIPLKDGTLRVIFKEPQWGITPGQSAVFYHGDTVLGGGIIK
jgi:tRNA-specific 2-thiouridylase